MTINDKIRDKELQCDVNRESTKISGLFFGKIGEYEYLTDEEILRFNQSKIIEQSKFTYCPLEKTIEKQTKMIRDQGEKQTKVQNP